LNRINPSSSAPEVVFNDSVFYNRNGYLRLKLVNKHFGLVTKEIGSYLDKNGMSHIVTARVQTKPLTPSDLDILVNTYVDWRDFEEVVPAKWIYRDYRVLGLCTPGSQADTITFFKEGKKTSESISYRTIDFYSRMFNVNCTEHKGIICAPIEVADFNIYPCSKRGNVEYIRQVKVNFEPFTSRHPLTFFDTTLDRKRKRKRKTNMLYVTGTTDPSICGYDMGWLEFGSHWNSFVTNIKQQFGGKIVYVRTWQSHKNGYPHFHALIYFKDIEFTAVPNWDYNEKTGKRDKLSWRIPTRSQLHNGDKITIRQRIKKAWKYGTVDIICVSDTQKAFKDMLKYVTRDLEGGESDLTNTMVWYFGKQAFSHSKDFAEVVWGKEVDIDLNKQIDVALINPNRCNSNLELIRVEIYPMVSAQKVYVEAPKSHQRMLFGGKDPPPEVEVNVDFIENSICDYDLVECKPSDKFDCPVFMYVPSKK